MSACTTTSTDVLDTTTRPSNKSLTQQLKQPLRFPEHVRPSGLHVQLKYGFQRTLQPAKAEQLNDEPLRTDRLPFKPTHAEQLKYNKFKTAISQEPERRQTPLLTDKDNHYLKMLEDKQRVMGHEMTNSRMMRDNNPEHMPEPRSQRLNYKLGDSLSRELHDFEKR